jgi:multicomponent Na+:H+ antiporter subunit F
MAFYNIALILLAVMCLLVIVRSVIGPTIWDRLLGLSMLSAKIITFICLFALMTGKTMFLDVALIFSLLGFISNVLISRYVRRKSSND